MGMVARNRSFLIALLVIMVCGLAILGGFTAIRVLAEDATTTAAVPTQTANYNDAGSYGITGYAPVTIQASDTTPEFVSEPLQDERGVILLVYVKGASADQEMLASFNKIKASYASKASFYNFEARQVPELGDILAQIKVNQPPMLVIIKSDGTVAQLYTGWIGEKVMEQAIADAVRGQ